MGFEYRNSFWGCNANLGLSIFSRTTSLRLFKIWQNYLVKPRLEVCDGQQLDIDFETRNDVTIDEYIEYDSIKNLGFGCSRIKNGRNCCPSIR